MSRAPELERAVQALAIHHRDAAKGYEQAAATATSEPAKLYDEIAGEHRHAAETLDAWIEGDGGVADADVSARSILYRAVMGVRAIINGDGPEGFAAAIQIERAILERYDAILAMDEAAEGAEAVDKLRRDLSERIAALEG